MVSHGWTGGTPPGQRPYGTLIHKGAVMAIIQSGPNTGQNMIQLNGECRNMTDHRADPKVLWDITSELTRLPRLGFRGPISGTTGRI